MVGEAGYMLARLSYLSMLSQIGGHTVIFWVKHLIVFHYMA